MKKLFLVLPCMVLLILPAVAQTFTALHSFTGSDGATLRAGLILSGNTLYGTTSLGGSKNNGTVFAINTDGTGFTNLYNFTAGTSSNVFNNVVNNDGAAPVGGLILSGNTLYGTTGIGGSSGVGTVFAINTDGTGFTNLYNFTVIDPTTHTNGDGAYPIAGLILSGNTLYGTTGVGGRSGVGTVFAINTNGTGFTNLYSFTAIDPIAHTNSDGANPDTSLILSGSRLYGTANSGGRSGNGTVFAINTNGAGFTNLYSFTALDTYSQTTNSDGANPYGSLILSGNTLYGTAISGGSSGVGTVFAIRTDGTGFTNLYSFTAGFANHDGAKPQAGLVLSSNTLYGTTTLGGTNNNGTVFAINTDGTGFTNLYSFAAMDPNTGTNSDGAMPHANLIFSSNTVYGTTPNGGIGGKGTVFSLSLASVAAPQLNINLFWPNVILAWPANAAGFTLQSTTNLEDSPVIWSVVSPAPVVVNGQKLVTNSIVGMQHFYRLSQ